VFIAVTIATMVCNFYKQKNCNYSLFIHWANKRCQV